MQILGITGGVATGKSTITRLFSELGAPTASADQIARDLLAPGTPMTQAVLTEFSHVSMPAEDGLLAVNRRALGQLVFGDAMARQRLEELTHPGIRAVLKSWIALRREETSQRAAAVEIPLLFESHLEWMVDKIIVVACDEATQVTRLCNRAGVGEAEARGQIAAQWPLADKISRADYLIRTDDSLGDVERQVQALWDSDWLIGAAIH